LKTKKKIIKRILWTLAIGLILLNIVAFFHSYKFTHYSESKIEKTKDPRQLSFGNKLKTLIFGIDNPRPANIKEPTQKFETIILKSNKEIECWSIKTEKSKGTVVLFHGYSGQKSSMLDKSDEFIKLGYSTLLVDFMGSGGSEGNQTTVGFQEAEQVKTCFDYLTRKGEDKIYMFGTSMGAVAILKAINDYNILPTAIIIECPFGSMYQTVCARFKTMQVPKFPMAGLLVLWGGVQYGFWSFGFRPTVYAKKVNCPTLLLYGEKDEKVSKQEIEDIYSNLNCKKQLKTFPLAGHENYLIKYKQEWIKYIKEFIE
jgi:uncharacterized protein